MFGIVFLALQLGIAEGACCREVYRNPRDAESINARQLMNTGTDIEDLCRKFTDALTEVLAENASGPARRGRLARARAALKRNPDCSEHAYLVAVETAFIQWEAVQNVSTIGR